MKIMENKYRGLTVNERLYVSGLIDDFDNAVSKKNKVKIIEILKKVEINDENTINQILKDFDIYV